MITDTADLTQAARDLIATARKMRGGHEAAHREAGEQAGAHELAAAAGAAVDALDSLLDSEAAKRLERALVRLEWAR